MRWRVRHTFDEVLALAAPAAGYPSLSVTFELEGGGLRAVVHEVETDDSLHAGEAIRVSDARLRILWGTFDFLRGSLPRRSSSAHRVVEDGPHQGSAHLHANLSVVASGVAIMPLKMPAEGVLSSVQPRLLDLANAARDEDDAAHALRDYDIILEALGKREPRVKHARDFVSHGGPLASAALLTFVRTELLDPTVDRFDPGNRAHLEFVAKMRNEAKVLVEREIGNRLR